MTKPNAVRLFDAETLHEIIARRMQDEARYMMQEAERLIASAPAHKQAAAAPLVFRLWQRCEQLRRRGQEELDKIEACQILRGEGPSCAAA